MNRFSVGITLILCGVLTMLVAVLPAGAATAPPLGTAADFAVLAGTTVTNTGSTVVSGGHVGVSPGSAIVGFPPGVVTPPGEIHAADAVALQAQNDLTTAYNNLAGQACDENLTGQDLGGMTLTPGTYCFDTSAQLTGALTLDAQGNPDSVFIFQIGSTLTTAANSSVGFINGTSCHVYWQVGSSATLGTTTDFKGNILALTSITANTGANVEGRLLARNGAVTLDANVINNSDCSTLPTPSPSPSPTLSPTPSPSPSPTLSPTPSPSPTEPADDDGTDDNGTDDNGTDDDDATDDLVDELVDELMDDAPDVELIVEQESTTTSSAAATAESAATTGAATTTGAAATTADDRELARTGNPLPLLPTVALGLLLIVAGNVCLLAPQPATKLAQAFGRYQPKRRIPKERIFSTGYRPKRRE